MDDFLGAARRDPRIPPPGLPLLPPRRAAPAGPGLPAAREAAPPDPLLHRLLAAETLGLIRAGRIDAADALLGERSAVEVDALLRAGGATVAEASAILARRRRGVDARMRELERGQAGLWEITLVLGGSLAGGEYADQAAAESSLRRSRVFDVTAAMLAEATAAVVPDDLRSPYLIAPFPRFAICPDAPIRTRHGDLVTTLWVDASTDEWTVYARFERDVGDERNSAGDPVARPKASPESCILSRGVDIADGVLLYRDAKRGAERVAAIARAIGDERSLAVARLMADETPEDSRGLDDGEAVEIGTLARNAVGFAMLLNARGVEIVPASPRDLGVPDDAIDGDGPRARRPRYRVVVPAKRVVRDAVASVRRGTLAICRRPHWVRRHRRQYASGLVVLVRRHTRGGEPGAYLPLYHLRPPVPGEPRPTAPTGG